MRFGVERVRPLAVGFALVVAVGAATPAYAAIFTAYQVIEDVEAILDGSTTRDLSRTHNDSTGTTTIGSTPAEETQIVTENNLSASFGLDNDATVTYTHLVNWLVPAAATFTDAILTIKAWDPDGNNDQVVADTIPLGALGNNNDDIQTTVFNNDLLQAQLIDGVLNITITKQGENNTNGLNVFYSKLFVEYSDTRIPPDPAPEPMTLSLLGFGLLGVAYGARKRRAKRR